MFYEQITTLPPEYVKRKIKEFLQEDLPYGDVTTESTIHSNTNISAEIQVVSHCVFSGVDVIPCCFPESYAVEINKNDGDRLIPGDIIGTITGPASYILTIERVMLNLVQRLCGIASLTRKFTKIAEPFNVKILDTRKTTPGLRLFEKYAVKCGGGWNHRSDLSTGILIKDNHIQAAGGIKAALENCKNSSLPIELEVDTLQQVEEGLVCKADGFLLDNMSPDLVKKSVNKIRSSENGKEIFIEASGGINLDTLLGFMDTGIDAVSTGAITHSAKNTDLKLEFKS